ncbi:hypothetical protein PS49_219 [Aeromonas phage PS49]
MKQLNARGLTKDLLEYARTLAICIYRIGPSSQPGFIEITLSGPANSIATFEKMLCKSNMI